VVLFNIGPVTPFTEYGLFDSVSKPRHTLLPRLVAEFIFCSQFVCFDLP
jgi:hypothetical protein